MTNKKKIIKETYEEYLNLIFTKKPETDKWIYDIIDGISEQESILYRNENLLIIPSYEWINYENTINLHLLGIPTNTTLRTLRDLRQKDIKILEEIQSIGLDIIKTKFNIPENQIKVFLHYHPTTFHLHVHFQNIGKLNSHSSVEHSHELNTVIFNLKMCDEYYKLITLTTLTCNNSGW
jgi:m7GpppX diphosphatase